MPGGWAADPDAGTIELTAIEDWTNPTANVRSLPVGDLAHLEATLADSDGAEVATATATALVIRLDQAREAV